MNGATVFAARFDDDPAAAVRLALERSGILAEIGPDTRVALKPNLTYPYYKPGVTTSPRMLRETVLAMRQRTSRITVVETDGGYGAWKLADAFEGHGIHALVRELGIEAVNLCQEPSEPLSFGSRFGRQVLPLPVRLLRQTDLFVTMPVPKIHCMTGLSLAYKNQWGCVPDIMRLRRHYIFDDAIVAINQALRPAVLADGTYFLDRNGPMDGDAIRMGLIIAAGSAGAFDRYVSELMGVPWRRVGHLRKAVQAGDMPAHLADIAFNEPPTAVSSRRFELHRTMRNWIALAGFKSRTITWLGYESWFGKVVLHALLYAVYGPSVRPRPTTPN